MLYLGMEKDQKFNRLTAISKVNKDYWLFRCECGAEKKINYRNVRSGKSASCGCLQKERTSARKKTHGHSVNGKISPEFQAYRSMIARCYRKTNISFDRYGGRGISVCDRWRFGENGVGGFEMFLQDVGFRPSPEYSIDRFPDNDGNYEPGNVRWADLQHQGSNKRNNVLLEVFGDRLTVAQASRKYGIPYCTLKNRVLIYGWPHETAVCTPVGAKPKFG